MAQQVCWFKIFFSFENYFRVRSSPSAAVARHQGLQYAGHRGQLRPDDGRHVGLAELLPLPPRGCGAELHRVRLGSQHEAGSVLIVDPHVPVSQQSGHANTSNPSLSAAVAQVGGLEKKFNVNLIDLFVPNFKNSKIRFCGLFDLCWDKFFLISICGGFFLEKYPVMRSDLAEHRVRQSRHDVLRAPVLLLQTVVPQAALQDGFPAEDQGEGGEARH